ncbi:glycosyltransferase involved in cell wall biosynthesis [Hydrogenoanaerobacterium saccharovorans]|uniref:Glycosyltransferase involved in cell wall bisynthesis n=1 Tax=Hydrogenoanaerobacterium saccharovorans TaxID=474960 RepID=A0A1H8EER8_9FIRM|nr:glycosyltransferase family 2 protein [Hydrogenoanaerobacterium saccharovorans]RPF42145.1 glycosyltransferase involved in cell wall biosynthesis [Hydrogenoanaerobacterium saccharovorans]SEN18005.1 Glycosyltransferase involved in cell wall bisynthesis [Hydrogenoanaerobacterium saccharovorans]
MKLLIIIPAYNEQGNIKRVVDSLIHNYPQYDYIVINDGSKDNTLKICQNENYNYINLPINLGLSGAFQTGMKYAYIHDYDYAIQYDADGQHRAEYIEDILDEIKNGYDIVIGSRFVIEKKKLSFRMMGSHLISFAILLTTGKKIKDPTSGMRIYNRGMIEEFANNLNYGPEPDTISYLMRQGAKIAEIQAKMDERIEGESYLNTINSIKYMLKMGISILLVQWVRKRNPIVRTNNPLQKEAVVK